MYMCIYIHTYIVRSFTVPAPVLKKMVFNAKYLELSISPWEVQYLTAQQVQQSGPLNSLRAWWHEDFVETTRNKVVSDRSLGDWGGLEQAGAC